MAVGQASGVLLDPVYSGKALHCLLGRMRAQPEAWRGKRVLFVHTGGLLVRGHQGVRGLWGGTCVRYDVLGELVAGVRVLCCALLAWFVGYVC
jgi:hypothetical protein